MWSYYGSKSKVVKYYPKPAYGKIIEPFAGSARYSLLHFENEVLLTDLDENIIKVWHYLQNCSETDIVKLPHFKEGDNIKDFNLSEEELLFCGFLIAKGVSTPQFKASKWTTTLQPTWIPYQLRRIANDLYKIKHWQIELKSFKEIRNQNATWFIDPPYQFGGQFYRKSNKVIDFSLLGNWCKTREGQIIVCENTKADWMQFRPLKKLQGTIHKTVEAMWCSDFSNSDYKQGLLF